MGRPALRWVDDLTSWLAMCSAMFWICRLLVLLKLVYLAVGPFFILPSSMKMSLKIIVSVFFNGPHKSTE